MVAVLLSTNACAGNHVKMDQTISWNNVGSEDVYDFQVIYGDYSFPRQPDARLGARGGKQATVAIPVPETCTVMWTTADRQQHVETVQIQRNVEGKDWFDGNSKLIFEVNGPNLRVVLVRKLPNFKQESTEIR